MAYEQTVTHLVNELELNRLEAPDELQMNSVIQHATKTNADRNKATCHHCKKPGRNRNQYHWLKKQRKQTESTENIPGNKKSGANISNPNSNVTSYNNNNNNHKNSNRAERKPKIMHTHHVRSKKTNHSTEKGYFGASAANRLPARQRKPDGQNQVQKRFNQSDSNESAEDAA